MEVSTKAKLSLVAILIIVLLNINTIVNGWILLILKITSMLLKIK